MVDIAQKERSEIKPILAMLFLIEAIMTVVIYLWMV